MKPHRAWLLIVALVLVALPACGDDDDNDDGAGGDTDTDTDGDADTDADADADGLHGEPPASAVPVPTFTALNSDGGERTEADLLGHPSVIWFYPVASTGG